MSDIVTKVLPLDQNFGAALKQLHDEGWDVAPGTVPQVTYQLVRPPEPAHGVIRIDDTKVSILRNGELLRE